MKIIADGGSTKTDWAIFDGGELVARFKTEGTNPTVMGTARFKETIERELLPNTHGYDIREIEFYGAGCTEYVLPEVRNIFQQAVPTADKITIGSDLIGACRATGKREECIVAILGTGSNSCLYDGRNITRHVPSLGFILSDEGSGAALGKLFLNALLKGRLPRRLKEELFAEMKLTENEIMHRIYHDRRPNTFLASFAPFLCERRADRDIRKIIIGNFRQFLALDIRQYGRNDLLVYFTGGIAYYFADCLKEAAEEENYNIGRITRSPLDEIIARGKTDGTSP